MNLDVELSSQITALNTPIEVWANVNDSSGTPQSGQTVETRHEAEGLTTSGVTSTMGVSGQLCRSEKPPIHQAQQWIGPATE